MEAWSSMTVFYDRRGSCKIPRRLLKTVVEAWSSTTVFYNRRGSFGFHEGFQKLCSAPCFCRIFHDSMKVLRNSVPFRVFAAFSIKPLLGLNPCVCDSSPDRSPSPRAAHCEPQLFPLRAPAQARDFSSRPQPKPARSPAASSSCSLHVRQPRPANPLPAQACDSSSRPFQDRVNSGLCPQPSPRRSGASSSPGHPVPPAGLP
ncbi:hypothetical protein TIFTF001_054869 [Ficus carica]|uniref:Uncharacterized protein n=1 Tax=Ficus carica TaxID=3494 RepID=A0AA88EG40_FICCA|nr:hypothetical protein TIFTF001_054866 [Ficus carica]GMN73438.1 hypothetical protein TIFTF001_054867 [Ficus carica]GMN73443.1 hypothetical protein TIFTF001_054868 [Ficus carica]GMN73447.1 hypothetical protein TIFTF001_054869 [Ficus carica]